MRFSIVVPVYGVEKYLEECVASLTAQTFTDFEVILVDDRSPDKSPEICDRLSETDERIRVIHKPVNEGLGFARNTGMAAAEGEYVLFVDSDDTVDVHTLERIQQALSERADVLVYGMEMRYEDKKGVTKWSEQVKPEKIFFAGTKEEKADMFDLLTRSRVFNYACNKAYRREFLLKAQTLFEKTKLIEDFLFNIEIFTKAETVASIPEALYFYRKPAHVTLASRPDPAFFILCKRKYLLEEDFLRYCGCLEKYEQLIYGGYVKHIVSVILRNKVKGAGLSRSEQKEKISLMLNDELTVRVIERFRPSSKAYKLIGAVIKKKDAGLMLTLCAMIDFAQHKLKPLAKKLRK